MEPRRVALVQKWKCDSERVEHEHSVRQRRAIRIRASRRNGESKSVSVMPHFVYLYSFFGAVDMRILLAGCHGDDAHPKVAMAAPARLPTQRFTTLLLASSLLLCHKSRLPSPGQQLHQKLTGTLSLTTLARPPL